MSYNVHIMNVNGVWLCYSHFRIALLVLNLRIPSPTLIDFNIPQKGMKYIIWKLESY